MSRERCIRVLLVDDHSVIRMGLTTLLGLRKDLEVVAEAEDGEQAVAQYRAEQPDVVLMDVRMPRMDGLNALLAIRAEWPQARILMLTTSDFEDDILRAIEAGASGYITKSAKPKEMVEAILQVDSGRTYLPPSIQARLEQCLKRKHLSKREVEVLEGVRRGLSNRDIALMLNISENTAKVHVRTIMQKLESADRTEAVARGFEQGLLRLD